MRVRRAFATSLLVIVSTMSALGGVGVAQPETEMPVETTVEELGRPDLEIFMVVGAIDDQIAGVRNALLAAPDVVAQFAFLDHEAAHREFARIWGDRKPELVRSTPPDALPTSFRVKVRDVGQLNPGSLYGWQQLGGVDDMVTGRAVRTELTKRRKRCNYPLSDLEAFMQVNASDEQIREAKRAIRSLRGVDAVEFISHDEALHIYRCFFAGDPTTETVTAAALPASFRITVAPHADVDALVSRIQATSGVDEVTGKLVSAA